MTNDHDRRLSVLEGGQDDAEEDHWLPLDAGGHLSLEHNPQ